MTQVWDFVMQKWHSQFQTMPNSKDANKQLHDACPALHVGLYKLAWRLPLIGNGNVFKKPTALYYLVSVHLIQLKKC
jgi:hypothetical protein